jgi:hypothetical protein
MPGSRMFSPQCGTGMLGVYAAARIISRTTRLPQLSLPRAHPGGNFCCRMPRRRVKHFSPLTLLGCDYLKRGAPSARGHVVKGRDACRPGSEAVDGRDHLVGGHVAHRALHAAAASPDVAARVAASSRRWSWHTRGPARCR